MFENLYSISSYLANKQHIPESTTPERGLGARLYHQIFLNYYFKYVYGAAFTECHY